MVHGKVFLVGAGPGDPKLLTIKALELLQNAKNIVYDRLISKEILALIPKNAEKIYVGKESGRHAVPQDKITELLVKMALEGKDVVRLKGGDPFIFGRGGEEAESLAENGIDFEIIPGVSSSVVAPMYAGIPLTHRDYASSVAIVTGHQAGEGKRNIEWTKIVNAVDTVVILMGIESLPTLVDKLIIGGIDSSKPVAIIEKGTLNQQRTITGTINSIVNDAKKADIKPPAVIVIGEVVKLSRKLEWFKPSQP
jgi:uroporphyrin-III C-methyltransferase